MKLKAQVFTGLVVVFIFSIPYSKFLLSLSMIGFVLLALVNFRDNRFKLAWNPNLRSQWNEYKNAPWFWMLSLVLVSYLFSGFWSENLSEWSWRVRTKSPFIFIPLAFFFAPTLNDRLYIIIWRSLIIMASISLSIVLSQYLIDPEGMTELIYYGKPIPTPCHHIRYSLFIAFAGVVAVEQALKSVDTWKYIMWALALLLAIGLHMLAVRSGILAYYGCLWVYLFFKTKGKTIWIWSFTSLVLFLCIPYLAYQWSPTFKQKMDYVKYDWEQFQKGEGSNYSDGDRWASIQAGYHLFMDHPLIGVGMGDLKEATMTKTEELGLIVNRHKFPHNQFLFVLAGVGLSGFLLFMLGFLSPLFWITPSTQPLLWAFYGLILLSFLAEHTIETAVGTALTIGFIALLTKEAKDRED